MLHANCSIRVSVCKCKMEISNKLIIISYLNTLCLNSLYEAMAINPPEHALNE